MADVELRDAAVGHQCADCVNGGARSVRQATTPFGVVQRRSRTPVVTYTLIGLNVAMFAVSGLLGMNFLFRTLSRLVYAIEFPRESTAPNDEQAAPTVLPVRHVESRIQSVFSCWALVFGLVGMQMSWVLRPFIGTPDAPFAWFRPRSSSFFEAVIALLRHMFGG